MDGQAPGLARAVAGLHASTLIRSLSAEACTSWIEAFFGGGGGKWISVCRTVTSLLLLNVVKLERLLI